MIPCTICNIEVSEFIIYTCNSCNYPFCHSCINKHWSIGYHANGTWVDDGIYRPLIDHSAMDDGNGIWIPATEPESWGNWRPI